MQKIVELDQGIINKIAAGEVIERPASVVKELVENAIDAEATRIEVAVEDGGRKRISVRDNGYGMVDADLAAAFKSHATSKLKSPDDLFKITTMGFRGEALPSIGAVSRSRIVTCYRGHSVGAEITMDGGAAGPVVSKGAPEGTGVDVRDLFYNTPVRRKFLKASSSEMRAITDTVSRIALAHCHIGFSLTHNGRTVFTLEMGQRLEERIGELFDREVREGLVPVAFHQAGLSVSGFAVKPSVTRQNSQGQYTYINSRFIRDRRISAATRNAYQGFLMVNRYPMVFLFLDMDPAAVDVNVHPTKVEVRFKDPNAIYGAVVRSIRQALESAELVAKLRVEPSRSEFSPDRHVPRQTTITQAVGEFLSNGERSQRMPFTPENRSGGIGGAPPSQPEPLPWKLFQIHDQYIVTESDTGVRLVDQHALHEKILYTKLVSSQERGPVQRLLVPITVELSASEWAGVETVLPLLREERFEIEEFGERTLAVYAVPQLLAKTDLVDLVRSAVTGLSGQNEVESARHALYAMVACKAAVKAGMHLAEGEMVSLLNQHAAGGLLDFCPHGRPAILDITLDQLDKQFGRI